MFKLPGLPYGYGALTPVISETTLRTHHGKHHARYVEVTNGLLAQASRALEPLEDVIVQASRDGSHKLFNNAAQAWNHGFFWECMRAGGAQPPFELMQTINQAFGGLPQLRDAFIAEGVGHFGSGWVWLTARDGELSVLSTHDAGVPITVPGVSPLLVCDLWEHAYYLDHKNDRAGYLGAWWDLLVNWNFVADQYDASEGRRQAWRYPAPEIG